jgi:hypothetical protein
MSAQNDIRNTNNKLIYIAEINYLDSNGDSKKLYFSTHSKLITIDTIRINPIVRLDSTPNISTKINFEDNSVIEKNDYSLSILNNDRELDDLFLGKIFNNQFINFYVTTEDSNDLLSISKGIFKSIKISDRIDLSVTDVNSLEKKITLDRHQGYSTFNIDLFKNEFNNRLSYTFNKDLIGKVKPILIGKVNQKAVLDNICGSDNWLPTGLFNCKITSYANSESHYYYKLEMEKEGIDFYNKIVNYHTQWEILRKKLTMNGEFCITNNSTLINQAAKFQLISPLYHPEQITSGQTFNYESTNGIDNNYFFVVKRIGDESLPITGQLYVKSGKEALDTNNDFYCGETDDGLLYHETTLKDIGYSGYENFTNQSGTHADFNFNTYHKMFKLNEDNRYIELKDNWSFLEAGDIIYVCDLDGEQAEELVVQKIEGNKIYTDHHLSQEKIEDIKVNNNIIKYLVRFDKVQKIKIKDKFYYNKRNYIDIKIQLNKAGVSTYSATNLAFYDINGGTGTSIDVDNPAINGGLTPFSYYVNTGFTYTDLITKPYFPYTASNKYTINFNTGGAKTPAITYSRTASGGNIGGIQNLQINVSYSSTTTTKTDMKTALDSITWCPFTIVGGGGSIVGTISPTSYNIGQYPTFNIWNYRGVFNSANALNNVNDYPDNSTITKIEPGFYDSIYKETSTPFILNWFPERGDWGYEQSGNINLSNFPVSPNKFASYSNIDTPHPLPLYGNLRYVNVVNLIDSFNFLNYNSIDGTFFSIQSSNPVNQINLCPDFAVCQSSEFRGTNGQGLLTLENNNWFYAMTIANKFNSYRFAPNYNFNGSSLVIDTGFTNQYYKMIAVPVIKDGSVYVRIKYHHLMSNPNQSLIQPELPYYNAFVISEVSDNISVFTPFLKENSIYIKLNKKSLTYLNGKKFASFNIKDNTRVNSTNMMYYSARKPYITINTINDRLFAYSVSPPQYNESALPQTISMPAGLPEPDELIDTNPDYALIPFHMNNYDLIGRESVFFPKRFNRDLDFKTSSKNEFELKEGDVTYFDFPSGMVDANTKIPTYGLTPIQDVLHSYYEGTAYNDKAQLVFYYENWLASSGKFRTFKSKTSYKDRTGYNLYNLKINTTAAKYNVKKWLYKFWEYGSQDVYFYYKDKNSNIGNFIEKLSNLYNVSYNLETISNLKNKNITLGCYLNEEISYYKNFNKYLSVTGLYCVVNNKGEIDFIDSTNYDTFKKINYSNLIDYKKEIVYNKFTDIQINYSIDKSIDKYEGQQFIHSDQYEIFNSNDISNTKVINADYSGFVNDTSILDYLKKRYTKEVVNYSIELPLNFIDLNVGDNIIIEDLEDDEYIYKIYSKEVKFNKLFIQITRIT